jgi:Ca2+-binding EF-hand superfamily protein
MSLEAHLKVFDLHDADYRRVLPKKEVANVLRTCGRLATQKEMDELLKTYADPVARSDFIELVKSLKPGPKEGDLLVALQAFDHKELGTLSRVEVSSIFTQMTERVSPQELTAVLEGLAFGADDRVAIPLVVAKLMAPMTSVRVPISEVGSRIQQR